MKKEIEKIIREYSSDTDYSDIYWDECSNQICSLLVDRLEKIRPFKSKQRYDLEGTQLNSIVSRYVRGQLIKEIKETK